MTIDLTNPKDMHQHSANTNETDKQSQDYVLRINPLTLRKVINMAEYDPYWSLNMSAPTRAELHRKLDNNESLVALSAWLKVQGIDHVTPSLLAAYARYIYPATTPLVLGSTAMCEALRKENEALRTENQVLRTKLQALSPEEQTL